MNKISIAMILDLNCSWCPIGYRYLMQAINNLQLKPFVDVTFMPYQLNPNMPKEGEPINTHLMKATGKTENELMHYREGLLKTAESAKVNIDFSKRTHYHNTLKGHMLLQFSQKQQLQHEVYRILCHAYYENGLHFDDDSVLTKVGKALNIPFENLKLLLSDKTLETETLEAERRAISLNITSVPSFMLDNKEIITGSGSVSFFERLLTDFYSERQRDLLRHTGGQFYF